MRTATNTLVRNFREGGSVLHGRGAPIEVTLLPTLPMQAGASMILYTSNLLQALQTVSCIRAHVFCPPFGSSPSSGRLRSRWMRYVNYVRWSRELSGDLFHVTDHANAQLLLGLPAARTVVTCHDLYPVTVALGRLTYPGSESRMQMAPTAFRLRLLRKAAAIIAISQHTLRECQELLGIRRDRLFLAYYGISDVFRAEFHREARESFRRRHSIRPEQIAVLHVGSNDARKNIPTVFRVLALLREEYGKEACLVKVGSKLASRELITARTLGLAEGIRDLGPLSVDQTANAYRACDVLLYPSFHEGFCRPAAEALASGTPVVTSNRGAIPEVVQDSRLLFEPQDAEGMARRIIQITESNGLREELVRQGRLAAQKFTWEAHGAAVREAYCAVVRRWA